MALFARGPQAPKIDSLGNATAAVAAATATDASCSWPNPIESVESGRPVPLNPMKRGN